MKKNVVTGAAGFIGSNLARSLNSAGIHDLILVDKFDDRLKNDNLSGLLFERKIERDEFIGWFKDNYRETGIVFHLGAQTDTTESDFSVFNTLNLEYSKALWQICTARKIPLVYASSAATYGSGDKGFSDEHALLKELKPLNPYGESKHLFDLFAVGQQNHPPFWIGLKFFNVYGPYEAHKGRMASVVFHAYNQIKSSGKVKLFLSHRPEYKDGEQLRDFIYVDDVINVCLFFGKHAQQDNRNLNGIYNVGAGKAQTFNDLAKAIFTALGKSPQIEYVPIPEDIRGNYQYFTEAKIEKLRLAGFTQNFLAIEKGVEKYVAFLSGTQ